MHNPMGQAFDSLESAQEFMILLAASIEEAAKDLEDSRLDADEERQDRRVQALDLALYKLRLLDGHVHKSRRILNDLRTIRRLLYSERAATAVA
jgi:division protein CdvB (Snf7/Vps24/ESCRT-III family)